MSDSLEVNGVALDSWPPSYSPAHIYIISKNDLFIDL